MSRLGARSKTNNMNVNRYLYLSNHGDASVDVRITSVEATEHGIGSMWHGTTQLSCCARSSNVEDFTEYMIHQEPRDRNFNLLFPLPLSQDTVLVCG